MTSNLGSHIIQEKLEEITDENMEDIMGELRVRLLEMLKQTIRPEFLNRIDEIILFKPLSKTDIRQIVELQLKHVQQLVLNKNIALKFTDEAKQWLAELGYEPSFGARPLKRVIQKYVVNYLSEKILGGEIVDGDSIEIGLDDRGLIKFAKTT